MENYRVHSRKQRKSETVQDFLSALRWLAINCNFEAYLDIALQNQLVFGLRSKTDSKQFA